VDYVYDLVGKIQQVSDPTDLLPSFRTKLSMISDEGKGKVQDVHRVRVGTKLS
jgi:hypothetical protein